MHKNESLAMDSNSNCLHLRAGGEYAHQPLHPFLVFIRQIQMILVDRYGVHLEQLTMFRFMQSHPMFNPSACIVIPFIGQQHKILRFVGHSISHSENKTLHDMDTPKLILSKIPITQNMTNASCIVAPNKANKEEIIYKMNIMQNETKAALRYFATIGSQVSFSRIGLFDEEITLKSGDRKYQDFIIQNNTEKHLLLNAIPSEKYSRADPIITLKIASMFPYLNPEIDHIQISVAALQHRHFYDNHSKTCVINENNEECIFMISSGNDHHILIQNQNKHSHRVNISFETSHRGVHPEAINVFNHYPANNNHNVFASMLFAFAIVVGIMGLVAVILNCHYRQRRNNYNRKLRGILSNRKSFFTQILPRNADEYQTDSSSI